jgi:DNA topoisomerase I
MSKSQQYIAVIVESPNKCKKIEEYLGEPYRVKATYGHIYVLNGLKSIDMKNNFTPEYTLISKEQPKKSKQIHELKQFIRNAQEVILATDDDREGEAIAYHLCMECNLPIETTKRIRFHEITRDAIQTAVQNPTIIHMDTVHSQQARQVLDVLVGFKISPLLWKHICFSNTKSSSSSSNTKSLSAGRCQTPALRLVYENEMEIQQFLNTNINATNTQNDINSSGHSTNFIYKTNASFLCSSIPLQFELNHIFTSRDKLKEFLSHSSPLSPTCFQYSYIGHSIKKRIVSPPQPLTTSRLQQLASNEFHISPKITMQSCQKLYEAGLITYMRTDSQSYSTDFLHKARQFILNEKKFGEKYIHPHLYSYSSSSKSSTSTNTSSTNNKNTNAQLAHEAIRPTNIQLYEIYQSHTLSLLDLKMYRLIYQTTLASCMSSAIFNVLTASIQAPMEYLYTYQTDQVIFDGWTKVKSIFKTKFKSKETETNKTTETNEIERNSNNMVEVDDTLTLFPSSLSNTTTKTNTNTNLFEYFKHLQPNTILQCQSIQSIMTIKELKHHYTEARLVQLLEKHGIGRPSTFSNLIDKIQERGYVKKMDIDGKQIECIDYTMNFMNNNNSQIQETTIIKTFGGEKNKLVIQPLGRMTIAFLLEYFDPLFNYEYTNQMETQLDCIAQGQKIWYELCHSCLNQIKQLLTIVKKQVKTKSHIQIDNEHQYMMSSYGPTIKKTDTETGEVSFLKVKGNIDYDKLTQGEYNVNDVVDDEPNMRILGDYEGKQVLLHRGPFGIYVSWNEKNISLSSLPNYAIDNSYISGVNSNSNSSIKTKYRYRNKFKSNSNSKTNSSMNPIQKEICRRLNPEPEPNTNEQTKNQEQPKEQQQSLPILTFKEITLEHIQCLLCIPYQRELSTTASIRTGKFGDYVYFKHPNMKRPKFISFKGFKHDYKECDVQLIRQWLEEKHKVFI